MGWIGVKSRFSNINLGEPVDDVIYRLIAGSSHDEACTPSSLALETPKSVQGLEQPLVKVAEAVLGSPDLVDEALIWLLGAMAVALSFKRE